MKPVIGVIPLFDEEKDSIWMLPGYLEGVSRAGGLPIVLPLKSDAEAVRQACDMCDGFLLTGGHDVEPSLYGESRRPECGPSNPDRDVLEKQVFEQALINDKPVLGICRGIQMINVLLGGSLYQDLPSEYDGGKETDHHMQPPYDVPCHKVTIQEGTPLYELVNGSVIGVNSYHHQAIKELAKGLVPMAVSEDGLVEAVYMPDKRFVWGVQWHPEFAHQTDENACSIFRAFLNACKREQEKVRGKGMDEI